MEKDIFLQYTKDNSNLVKKYLFKNDEKGYVKGLMNLIPKYKDTFIERSLYYKIGHHLFLLSDMEQGMLYIQKYENLPNTIPPNPYMTPSEKETAQYKTDLLMWFHKAQYYIEQGNLAEGKKYLRKCIARADINIYEEAETWGYEDAWKQYSIYIKDEIPDYPKEEPEVSPPSLTVEEIFSIEDTWEFATEYGDYISKKCACGEHMELLNQKEKVIYYAYTLDCEIHSGGFDSYFSSGCNYFPGTDNLTNALETLGAVHSLQLFETARKRFPNGIISEDFTIRQEIIENNHLDFEDLDDKFYEYEDHLDQLIFEYAHNL